MGESSGKQTKVIAIANQKGGVGKTTTSISVAAALAELGRLSLIIDLDMTAGATKLLGAPTTGWVSSYELLTGVEAPLDCVITDQDDEVKLPKGIHLIPSSRKLVELDQFLGTNAWLVPQDILLKPIDQLRGRYDYVILDTPPQITKTTVPAYKAADYIILAALPTHLSTEGLGEALRDIHSAQVYGNPQLRLLGVVVSGVRRPLTRLARQLIEYVETKIALEDGRSFKFSQDVSLSVQLQDAEKRHQTIFQYAPDSQIAEQYRAIAREMEQRIKTGWGTSEAPLPEAAEQTTARPGEAVNA